jgi:hypothetical protein
MSALATKAMRERPRADSVIGYLHVLIDWVQAEVAHGSGIRLVPELRRVGDLS